MAALTTLLGPSPPVPRLGVPGEQAESRRQLPCPSLAGHGEMVPVLQQQGSGALCTGREGKCQPTFYKYECMYLPIEIPRDPDLGLPNCDMQGKFCLLSSEVALERMGPCHPREPAR